MVISGQVNSCDEQEQYRLQNRAANWLLASIHIQFALPIRRTARPLGAAFTPGVAGLLERPFMYLFNHHMKNSKIKLYVAGVDVSYVSQFWGGVIKDRCLSR